MMVDQEVGFNYERVLRKANGDNVYAVWLAPWRECIGRVASVNRRAEWRIEHGPQGQPVPGTFTTRGDAATALHAAWVAQKAQQA